MFRWLLALVVFGFDRLTKVWALSLPYNNVIDIIGPLHWRLAYNDGLGFSLGQGGGDSVRLGILLIGVILTMAMAVWLYRTPNTQKPQAIALSFILGGAVGNLWDRLAYGYVIDFIHLSIDNWSWPTFNIADSAITLGAVWLIWQLFTQNQEDVVCKKN